jgi:hypothetical protein
MDRSAADHAVLASAIVTGGVWGYRKLVEPTASTKETSGSALKRLAGLEPTPAPTSQFLVGFAFTFLTLSLLLEASPETAGAFSILIATGSILTNGVTIFNDIGSQLGTEPKSKKKGK